ncbi:DUF3090 domain-containing protein [Actinorugispora endophytica]|uniref:Putative repeat protein (TIGR03847 family) n=1 Tax=Actinorugispora endophytica TaxID=1605990 RepID=A0A4R6UL49_9ACTN|nr:DUF3090 domain-containing protein [Actinorugispora endophytica]TDQ45855.1 putative repeat protein (TIGR03847 family) [Actinorugispora endophytica]
MPLFQYDPPERFVAGTVGRPGERTFFLQAAGAGRVTSVSLEKAQVAALAERVGELLEEVRRRFGDDPDLNESEQGDDAPLQQPIEEDFRVGTMALAWDSDTRRVVIEAQQIREVEPGAEPSAEEQVQAFAEAEEAEHDVLRVHLTPAGARAFADRALRVVAAGRPNCPLCGAPLDPDGHVCPRQNGYKPVGLE